MIKLNSRKLLAGFVSVAAMATAGACSSGASGGLSFGGGAGAGSAPGAQAGTGSGASGTASDSADSGGGTQVADSGSASGGSGSGTGSTSPGGTGTAGGSDGDETGMTGGGGGGDDEDGDLQTASSGTLQRINDDIADPILTAGNALLPGAGGATGQVGDGLDSLAGQGDAALNPAGTVVVSDQPVLGAGTDANGQQLAGVSALSSPSAQGQVLTANVAENGELLAVNADGAPLLAAGQAAVDDASGSISGALNDQQVARLSVGDATVGGSDPAIGAGVLSPTQPTGSLATLGVSSGGQTATADVNGASLTGGQGLLSGQVDNLTVGGDPALVGLGVLSPSQPEGSLATVGAGSDGETATLNLGGAGLVQ